MHVGTLTFFLMLLLLDITDLVVWSKGFKVMSLVDEVQASNKLLCQLSGNVRIVVVGNPQKMVCILTWSTASCS